MEFIEVWHYLIVGAFLALIIEVFTAGFIAGSVGIGLLLAALANVFGLSVEWQIIVFSIGLGASFFAIKPVMEKLIYNKDAEKTNQEAMIGKMGRVLEEINTGKGTGRVKLDGDDWKAEVEGDAVIAVGKYVDIIRIESIILIVKERN